eukprot:scaffold4646_cov267-Chaetoceros_neogracile.AAC.5
MWLSLLVVVLAVGASYALAMVETRVVESCAEGTWSIIRNAHLLSSHSYTNEYRTFYLQRNSRMCNLAPHPSQVSNEIMRRTHSIYSNRDIGFKRDR